MSDLRFRARQSGCRAPGRSHHPAESRADGPARSFGPGLVLASGLLAACVSTHASAQVRRPIDQIDELRGVEVVERLGSSLPTRLTLTNSDGETIETGSLFDGEKPVVLAFVYFGCPVVCPFYLDQLTNTLRGIDYTIGEDFRVVVVSIDHTEGVTESSGAKIRYTAAYGRDATTVNAGWSFLTGDEQSVRALADAAGWHYQSLPNGEYSHPAALLMVSPEGTVSRYMYGFELPTKQVKLGLMEASEGKIAESVGDKLMFYCYRFDPSAGAYSMEAMAVMRIAGLVTVAGLVALIGGLIVHEKTKRGRRPGPGTTPAEARAA